MADTVTNNLGSVRQWLRGCPEFAQNAYFGADFLKEEPELFALYSVPSTPRMRENILGDMELDPKQVQNFILAYRAPYGSAVQQNLDNLQVFQAVTSWIWTQNAAHNFPLWDGGEITSIVPTLTPVIMETGTDTARYQMNIRVTFHITESEG